MIFIMGKLLTFFFKNSLYIALVFILPNVVYNNIYSDKKWKLIWNSQGIIDCCVMGCNTNFKWC
jgi:uncharacterized membrane protein